MVGLKFRCSFNDEHVQLKKWRRAKEPSGGEEKDIIVNMESLNSCCILLLQMFAEI